MSSNNVRSFVLTHKIGAKTTLKVHGTYTVSLEGLVNAPTVEEVRLLCESQPQTDANPQGNVSVSNKAEIEGTERTMRERFKLSGEAAGLFVASDLTGDEGLIAPPAKKSKKSKSEERKDEPAPTNGQPVQS